MVATTQQLLGEAAKEAGSVIAVGSPRTPPELLAAVRRCLETSAVPSLFVPSDGPPAYPALIEASDFIFVTGDSVAMVADAVTTGKPVGLVPIAKSPLGRAATAIMDRLRPGRRLYPRDLRFFWAALKKEGFVGTLEAPEASDPPDYAAIIAQRVTQLLEQPLPQATDARDSGR
jgi:hypothetical protein